MKKHLSLLAALAMGAAVVTSCTDDEVSVNSTPADPGTTPVPAASVQNGVFVINSGNMYGGIPGSITYYDFTTQQARQNIFATLNGRSIGMTPNAGIIYGSKLYVAVDGENRVEVVDAASQLALDHVSTTDLLGAAGGKSPRHLLAHDGRVYVSTYGGCVAAIDTVDYSLKATYTVGSYPEGMALIGNTLYVACSDYGMGLAPCVSAIDLTAGTVTAITDENINNPSQLVAAGGDLYIVDGDLYNADWTAVLKAGGLRKYADGTVTPVTVTNMAMGADMTAAYEDKLYIVTDAYSGSPKLAVYDCATGSLEERSLAGVEIPNSIAIDPTSGEIFVTSYRFNAETGYGDYFAPGYVARYSLDGQLLGTFEAGIDPRGIVFNH